MTIPTLIFVAIFPSCRGSGEAAGGQATLRDRGTVRIDHDSVVRVDPATGHLQAVVRVGPDPLLMAVASGQVWTLNLGDGTLSRIDPANNRATTIRIGEAVGMTSDGEDLWVAADGNSLVRVDGATGKEEASLRLGDRPLFALRDAGFLALGEGAIWLTVPELGKERLPQTLWRIGRASGRVMTRIRIGPNPPPPLSDGRYLWVITMSRFTGELTRIDMRSNQVQEVTVGAQPWGLAAGAGSMWVGHQADREVWRLDPEAVRPTARIRIIDAARGVGFGDGRVWVTTETALLVIDPATNEVSRTIRLIERAPGEGPREVAYADGSIWISVE